MIRAMLWLVAGLTLFHYSEARGFAIGILAGVNARCIPGHTKWCPGWYGCHEVTCTRARSWPSCAALGRCSDNQCYREEKRYNDGQTFMRGDEECICCLAAQTATASGISCRRPRSTNNSPITCGSCAGYCGEAMDPSKTCSCHTNCTRSIGLACCQDIDDMCPDGSCANRCGGTDVLGSCWCTPGTCFGDCCADVVDKCATGLCVDHCCELVEKSDGSVCSCHSACDDANEPNEPDCCPGYEDTCACDQYDVSVGFCSCDQASCPKSGLFDCCCNAFP